MINNVETYNWEEIFKPNKSLNEKTQEAVNALEKIVETHAPMNQATQTKQKQLNKPWLTKDILKSIKRKRKMYLSKDSVKIG